MIRRPPSSTRTDTPFPNATLFLSQSKVKPLPLFLAATLWHAVRLAWRRKPEWVIAGSGLTAPIAWLAARCAGGRAAVYLHGLDIVAPSRSEEQTSELQSLMRITYAVFCLKKNTTTLYNVIIP